MQLNWRQLYFVLSSLLGLILIVIGATTILNNVLLQQFFKPERYPEMPPTTSTTDMTKLSQRSDLTTADKETIQAWTKDYEDWKVRQAAYDPEAESRKRAMANGITLLIVGIPVFVLHAPFVFRVDRSDKR